MIKIALFLLPFAILGITPRIWLTSIIGTVGYCLVAVIAASINPGRVVAMNWGVWVYTLLLLVYLSIAMSLGFSNDYGIEKGVYFISIILPLSIAVAFLIKKPEDVKYILWGFAVLGFLVAVSSFFYGRGVIGSHRYSWAGNLCAISAVIFLQFWIIKNKLLSFGLAVIASAGMAIAASKQAAVVLVVSFTGILLFNLFRAKEKKGEIVTFAALIVSTVVFWEWIRNFRLLGHLLGRFQKIMAGFGMAITDERVILFPIAWKEFLRYPILGMGAGGYADIFPSFTYYYPHNIFLEFLCEFGIVGTTLFFLPLFFAGLLILRRWVRGGGEAFRHIFFLFFCFLIIANFGGDFVSNRGVWIFGILMLRLMAFSSPSKKVSA